MAFDASKAAAALRKAMKGWGTDESTLIQMIAGSTCDQIKQIRGAYTKDIGRDLIADIKDECGGDFEDMLVALLMDRAEYDAMCIMEACKGIGTSENIISEILCTRTAEEITHLRNAYKTMYGKDMLSVIEDETSGDLQKTYNMLITRNEVCKEPEDVAGDIKELYDAGQGTWGTNEGLFVRKLCGRNREYNTKLYHEYAKKYGKALDDVIRDEIGGTTATALAYIVTPCGLMFAKKIYKSMNGVGTDDNTLIRCIASQKERHLGAANDAFLQEYKRSIKHMVEGDCGGDYKKVLCLTLDQEGARWEKVQK